MPQHPLIRQGLACQPLDWQAAARCYQQAEAEAPAESRFMLGCLAYQRQDYPQARHYLEQVLDEAQMAHPAHVLLGNLALLSADYPEAEHYFKRALALNPADLHVKFSLAELYRVQERWELVWSEVNEYLQFNPQDTTAWEYLAFYYQRYKMFFCQALCYQKIIELEPYNFRILMDLAAAWMYCGETKGPGELFERLLELTPAGQAWVQQLAPEQQRQLQALQRDLQYLNLMRIYADPDCTDQQLLAWKAYLKPPPLASQRPSALKNPAGRPLRIGYISRELANYSSAKLIWPLFVHHSAAVESYVYDETPRQTQMSFELMSQVDVWRDIKGQDSQQVAAQIRSDNIDVLVDLFGITYSQRHDLYALHPAPVQISGLGFVFSSMCQELDYCFSDAVLCPPEIAQAYPEKPLYLSSAFHWRPAPEFEISEPPCLQKGFITLGSSNTLNKLNPQVLTLWCEILKALPTARLFLKTPAFDDPLITEYYSQIFAQHGIAGERLQLRGAGQQDQHLKEFYNQIDIALDPFPYQGGVTTCEALWMGVPVLVMYHPDWRARALSASILTSLGLTDWLAENQAAYLQRAIDWAQDLTFLQSQRRLLRQCLLNSPVCDGPAFAREVEAIYQQLVWERYRQDAA